MGRFATPGAPHLVRPPLYLVEGVFEMIDQKKAAGVFAPPATATQVQSTVSVTTAQKMGNPEKQFSAFQAGFAMHGHRLERTFHSADIKPTFYTERWGIVRHLPTLEDARRFLAQIGGAA